MSQPRWSAFHQQVEDALARLIAHYDATLKVNGSNVLLCEYLAPRVTDAILTAQQCGAEGMNGDTGRAAALGELRSGEKSVPPPTTHGEHT